MRHARLEVLILSIVEDESTVIQRALIASTRRSRPRGGCRASRIRRNDFEAHGYRLRPDNGAGVVVEDNSFRTIGSPGSDVVLNRSGSTDGCPINRDVSEHPRFVEGTITVARMTFAVVVLVIMSSLAMQLRLLSQFNRPNDLGGDVSSKLHYCHFYASGVWISIQ